MHAEEEIDLGSEDDSEGDEEEESVSDLEEGGGALVFPESFAEALKQLLLTDTPVSVKDLPLKNKDEKLDLVYSLWVEGMVCTLDTGKKKNQSAPKKHKT